MSGEMRGESETEPSVGDAGAGWRRRSPWHPDLLGAAGDVNVEDLGFGDAGDASAEAEDDLVGEAVSDSRGRSSRWDLVAVLLGEDLRELGVFCVEEEAGDGEFAVLDVPSEPKATMAALRPGRQWTTARG